MILPSPNATGPIKGAFAVINKLTQEFDITVVFLKSGIGINTFVDKKIKVLNLNEYGTFFRKYIFLKNYLKNKKTSQKLIIFSMCFSGDLMNVLLNFGGKYLSFTSVRGNLLMNYFYSYGIMGIFLACFHLFIQRFTSYPLSLNHSISKQISFFSGKESIIIPNCVDEEFLEKFRKTIEHKDSPLTFVFIGDLSVRKNPILLINQFSKLKYNKVFLHIIGDGPLFNKVKEKIIKLGISDKTLIHGKLSEPYEILQKADVFVLPSYSEGTSRAMLEALFFGIPCLVRDVDCNKQIFNEEKFIGDLFEKDDELYSKMLSTALRSRKIKNKQSLLPKRFTQTNVVEKFKEIFNYE
ncbi:glycosyltransferase [Prochlorococcus marinus]|uniref:glycosyltransferase n=1 Tax=Prochlorococcus marinus TaxID=1219 RepID=UPI001C5596BA|nr:glycosyltransferase [Prochlorococcus marinus]